MQDEDGSSKGMGEWETMIEKVGTLITTFSLSSFRALQADFERKVGCLGWAYCLR